MSAILQLKTNIFGRKTNVDNRPPTIEWLLEHRLERIGKPALTSGPTPVASLYRMYEYFVTGYNTGLRSEIEYFFNRHTWAVYNIPDPKDSDPVRYAILAVLTDYLVVAFNRLINRGMPRNCPSIIVSAEMENELKSRPKILEKQPSWATKVRKVEHKLIIPQDTGEEPNENVRSARFLEMNIVAEEPHILFV